MTTFTNTQLSTIKQDGFIGNIDGNDVFAAPTDEQGIATIVLHKGGDVYHGLSVTTKFPHAYALFLIKGYNTPLTQRPENVAPKDRVPLTTITRRDVEEAMSRFNLGVQKPVEPGQSTMESEANFTDIEDVINTLDEHYRVSSYLKLRGHISYKATKLAGMFLAKLGKAYGESEGIDKFTEAMEALRGMHADDILKEAMGMENGEDMYETIRSMVLYANKLNFDLQELVDPTGKKRKDATFKFPGVTFSKGARRAGWVSSVKLVAEQEKANSMAKGTYADYVASIDNPEWTLSEEEWNQQQVVDTTMFDSYDGNIVDLIMDLDDGECTFDHLPIRTQIAAIENMRGKLPDILAKALKSVRYNREVTDKIAEASKVKGLVSGFDKMFCAMLSSSRYANFTEFMYNFIPTGSYGADDAPETRQMLAREERVTDNKLRNMKTNVHSVEDFLDLESDVV